MEKETRVSMYVTRACLVVPIQDVLHTESVLRIQEDILNRVYENGLRGAIIDLSGVAVIDRFIARKLFESAKMTSLLGTKTIITGLRAGVVASLIDLDFDPGDVSTAVDLDEGFRLLDLIAPAKEETEDGDEPDADADQDQGQGHPGQGKHPE